MPAGLAGEPVVLQAHRAGVRERDQAEARGLGTNQAGAAQGHEQDRLKPDTTTAVPANHYRSVPNIATDVPETTTDIPETTTRPRTRTLRLTYLNTTTGVRSVRLQADLDALKAIA